MPASELPLSNSLPDMTSLSGGPPDVTMPKTSGGCCQQPTEDEDGAEEMEDDMQDMHDKQLPISAMSNKNGEGNSSTKHQSDTWGAPSYGVIS